jgi:hypothetical protein
MKAYIWGNNQIVAVADNQNNAVKAAISQAKDYPDLVRTIVNTDPVEVQESKARILWTEWAVS